MHLYLLLSPIRIQTAPTFDTDFCNLYIQEWLALLGFVCNTGLSKLLMNIEPGEPYGITVC